MRGCGLRWLDIAAMCQTLVQSAFGPGHTLQGVHYFSALANHLTRTKPDVVLRHQTYLEALRSSGVEVALANFKRRHRVKRLDEVKIQVRPVRRWFALPFRAVRLSFQTYEEKETDVAISCKLLQLLAEGQGDAVMVISGDTDIAPAIRTAVELYPRAQVGIVFPFNRHNRDLQQIGHRHIRLNAKTYAAHQFPTVLVTSTGAQVVKPATW